MAILLAAGPLLVTRLEAPAAGAPGRVANWDRPLDQGTPGIVVDPSSWTMVAGRSVHLDAYLVPSADGCLSQGAAFTWQLVGLSDLLGYLNGSEGGSTGFQSYGYQAGTAYIEVFAAGWELCGWILRPYETSAVVPVTEVPSLFVSEVGASPDPARPGEPVELRVTVSGGCAPYNVSFEFGDGSGLSELLLSSGTVAVNHSFTTGDFYPSVRVVDALGEFVSAGASSPVRSTEALTVLPNALTLDLEADRPALLNASILGGVGPYTVVWNNSWGASHVGPEWWFVPAQSGPLEIGVRVTDLLGESAAGSLTFAVQPPMSVTVQPGRADVDVGEALPIGLDVSGGVPPYWINGTANPPGSRFALSSVQPGNLEEALVPAAAGVLWADVSATDALGGTALVTVPVAQVAPSPNLTLDTGAATVEVGRPIDLVGLASGRGPYSWNLTASSPLTNSTTLLPSSTGPALFAWTGTPEVPGLLVIALTVTDPAGISITRNLSLEVAPPLAVNSGLAISNSSGGPPPVVAIDFGGGVPPYSITITTSDGTDSTVQRTQPGTMYWDPVRNDSGSIDVSVTVSDASGGLARSKLAVLVGGPTTPLPNATGPPKTPAPPVISPPPGPSTTPHTGPGFDPTDFGSGTAAGILAVLLALFLLGRLRRKSRTEAMPPTGPTSAALSTVRRLLQGEEEGLERESLLLLCEDEGIARSDATAALATWERQGRIGAVGAGPDPSALVWHDPTADDPEPASSTDRGGGRAAEVRP